jgi:F-type H+-transporting ATPase subunit delta
LITNAIARRYAKALIELAAEENAVESFQDEMQVFASVLDNNPESSAFFSSPASSMVEKNELLKVIIDRLSISGTVANFLFLLQEKNRLSQLQSIIAGYRSLADELSGTLRGTVTSALPLDDSQVKEIRAVLEKSTGKKVLLQVEHDSSLIGGVVTKIGDKIFDGSIKTQLDRIQDILQKG